MPRDTIGQLITFASEIDPDASYSKYVWIRARAGDTIAAIAARRGHPELAVDIVALNKGADVLRTKPAGQERAPVRALDGQAGAASGRRDQACRATCRRARCSRCTRATTRRSSRPVTPSTTSSTCRRRRDQGWSATTRSRSTSRSSSRTTPATTARSSSRTSRRSNGSRDAATIPARRSGRRR